MLVPPHLCPWYDGLEGTLLTVYGGSLNAAQYTWVVTFPSRRDEQDYHLQLVPAIAENIA
jgi:hypothetical protein